MICPRPHCGGLLVWDEPEWVCKACARRWTEEKLRFEVRTGLVATQPVEEEPREREKTLAELLADEDDEPEKEPTMRRGWTKERRRKFQTTMAEKRLAQAGGRRAEEPKRETPATAVHPARGRL